MSLEAAIKNENNRIFVYTNRVWQNVNFLKIIWSSPKEEPESDTGGRRTNMAADVIPFNCVFSERVNAVE